jgi:hypothetical protein
MAGLQAMASERLVAGVIADARRRQRRRRSAVAVTIAVGLVVLLVALVPFGGGRGPGGERGARGLATVPVSADRLLASGGVSVRLPAGWVGKAAVLPQGGGNGLAWLQATNFPTGHFVHRVDALERMGAGQVAVTITAQTPAITHHSVYSRWPLTVSRAIRVRKAGTPRDHVVLELTPTIRDEPLVIDIDFGSRDTAARLTPAVDRLLRTVNVQSPSSDMAR